jgi:hypothetical protein
MPQASIEERLAALHAHYTSRVNAAVASGRMDLVRDLADSCRDEALELMLALEAGAADRPDHQAAEIMEFGGWPSWRVNRPRVRRHRFWGHGDGKSA